jgi:amino acid adenylation domain-containing protein
LFETKFLSPSEQHKILRTWNNTDLNFRNNCLIHELFEEKTLARPEKTAVSFYGRNISYGQLNFEANQLARALRDNGLSKGKFAAIIIDRSVEMIQSVIGVLKAGGAYVPLDPNLPQARMVYILNALEIQTVLTCSNLLDKVSLLADLAPSVKCIFCLDGLDVTQKHQKTSRNEIRYNYISKSSISNYRGTNLARLSTSEDLAYVIFTSGSTGTPKGVMVKHSPVINVIEWLNRTFHVRSSDKILFVTSLSFDISVYDIFGILAAGGTIHLTTSDDILNPRLLYDIITKESITLWDSAPAALQVLITYFSAFPNEHLDSKLRLVLIGGDFIPLCMPVQMKERFKRVNFISMGGATEATLWSNFYPVKQINPDWTTIPYGKPIDNARYYVLDKHLSPLPIGVPGDLYIGGLCLSSGYINDEKLTAEKFIDSPYVAEEKIYHTGDIAKWTLDGNLVFLGRIDSQVKIRGFRIELGEIEATLLKKKGMKDVIVEAVQLNNKEKLLCVYYRSNQKETRIELELFLRQQLPDYMIPTFFIKIDQIPVTPNGKIDRKALPKPVVSQISEFIAPREKVEEVIAEIFQKVLGFPKPLGIYDNFFDLGGHSLQAVKLISVINRQFYTELSVVDIFQTPTIEQLAFKIKKYQKKNIHTQLVCLKKGGGKRPLILIHPGGGDIACFIHLAERIDPERPVYAMKAYGLDNNKEPLNSIKQMATLYLKEISSLNIESDFLLGGFCVGGTIAFEMVRQLNLKGIRVEKLFLLESLCASEYESLKDSIELYLSFLRDFGEFKLFEEYCRIRNIRDCATNKEIIDDLKQQSHEQIMTHFFHASQKGGLLPSDRQQVEQTFKIYAGCFEGLINYNAKSSDCNVALFKATDQAYWEEDQTTIGLGQKFISKPHLGWEKIFNKTPDLFGVPGDHFSILKLPHVETLALKLNRYMKDLR